MVEYTCDETGDITQIVSTLGAGNHVDECCDEETSASHAVTSVADDCCRATVFSLPPTCPAPNQLAAFAAPLGVSLEVPVRDTVTRFACAATSPARSSTFSRNLPLLV